jgi:DNA-binding NtrC family response regulator
MMSFHWPGNLRELHNAADRFVLGLSDEEWVAQWFGTTSASAAHEL